MQYIDLYFWHVFLYNYINKILEGIIAFLNPDQKYVRFPAICQNTDAMFIAI